MHNTKRSLVGRFFYDIYFIKTKASIFCVITRNFSSFHKILNVFVQF